MLVVVAIAVALIAIAWACAWQTMTWLGRAEDLIEWAALESDVGMVRNTLQEYRRRTPGQST
jgi:hypothetical protein